jgi:hypothetical protein
MRQILFETAAGFDRNTDTLQTDVAEAHLRTPDVLDYATLPPEMKIELTPVSGQSLDRIDPARGGGGVKRRKPERGIMQRLHMRDEIESTGWGLLAKSVVAKVVGRPRSRLD